MSDATFNTDDFFNAAESVTLTVSPKRRFIIRQTRVDAHNVVRNRVLLTPSMCTKSGCTFDAAKDFGSWDNVPENKKDIIQEVLVRHVALVHNASEDLVVDEDQLPGQWISTGKGGIHSGI